MGDGVMVNEFPDENQRAAVCRAQLEGGDAVQIAIEGMIGWDLAAKDVRAQLDGADGDVELLINSPGGVVTEGIAMYNAIRDYKRKKKGTVTARVVGMAASMATYIPMAADVVEIEDNAVWMIHNPWGLAIGDYQDLRKQSEILDGLAKILARAYATKTDQDESDIRALMDEETYLYGAEIQTAGFADELIPAGDGAEGRIEAVALAQTRVAQVQDQMRELGEEVEDREALVALVRTESKPIVDGSKTAAMAENQEEGVNMDINTLKTEHPEVFAEAVAIGEARERDRVVELRSYVEADPANAKVAEVVNEAVAAGKTVAQINARLQVAIRDGAREDGENPPVVATAQDPMAGLDDVDREAMEAFGFAAEEVRKMKGGK